MSKVVNNKTYTINGSVRMIPFTGERTKARFGLTTGSFRDYIKPITLRDYNTNFTDNTTLTTNTSYGDVSYNLGTPVKRKVYNYNYNINTPDMTKDIIVARKGINAVNNDNENENSNKFKNFINNNSSDLIGAGANAIGSLASYFINRNAIKNMQAPSEPVPIMASKLKTKININPQLDELRENLAAVERNVNSNTNSSAVAQNRINRTRLNKAMLTNKLYADKENKETELINQDNLNRQSVRASNVASYNQYKDRVIDHNNKITELNSENRNAFVTGLNNSIQNVLTNREKRTNFKNNLLAQLAANPNSAKLFANLDFENMDNTTFRKLLETLNNGKGKN